MTAPMPETMSPREKVAAAIREHVKIDATGLSPAVASVFLTGIDHATGAILAALAPSGDHAELARLAEWRDRIRADPGRAAHFGSPYADKPMQNGRTYWNSDLADDITTLIAEVAALRTDNADLREHRITADLLVSMLKADKEEAGRKLAEAVGLLKPFSEAAECLEDHARDTDHIWEQPAAMCISAGQLRTISTFLSKEAERG